MQVSDTNIATAFYECYGLTYVCASVTKKIWYKFNGAVWVEADGDDKLSYTMSHGFVSKYEKYRASITRQQTESRDPSFKATCEAKIKIIGFIISKLTNTGPKTSILKEAKVIFKDDNFFKFADKNPNYMGLRNRVIETTPNYAVVRRGKPQDYVTLYSDIRWRENITDTFSV